MFYYKYIYTSNSDFILSISLKLFTIAIYLCVSINNAVLISSHDFP